MWVDPNEWNVPNVGRWGLTAITTSCSTRSSANVCCTKRRYLRIYKLFVCACRFVVDVAGVGGDRYFCLLIVVRLDSRLSLACHASQDTPEFLLLWM